MISGISTMIEKLGGEMNNFNEWYFDLFSKGDGARLNQQEIAEEAWYAQQTKIDELQERIDGAISILTGMRHNGAYRALDILKGESNDH